MASFRSVERENGGASSDENPYDRAMGPRPNLSVLDAARAVADTIQRFLGTNGSVPGARALARAARSMAVNIAEGSRTSGDVRDRCFCNARSFAAETREHWRLAFATEQLQPWVYWPIQHRLVTIVRILDASIEE